MSSDKMNEQKLLNVIEDHHTALAIGGRHEEFDKLVEYLEFYRKPIWKKGAIHLLKDLGIILGLLVILGLLGEGRWL